LVASDIHPAVLFLTTIPLIRQQNGCAVAPSI
jgi:hypothetical protein